MIQQVKTSKSYLCLALAVMLAPAVSRAAIFPYTADANTTFLFHLDGASGTSTCPNLGSVGGNSYTVIASTVNGTYSANPTVSTAMLGAASFSAAFGTAVSFPTLGGLVGFDGNNNGAFQGDASSSSLSPDDIAQSTLGIGVGSWTIEAMVKPANDTVGQEIVCMDSAASSRGFQFKINSSSQLQFQTIGGTAYSLAPSISSVFTANTWYHAAVVYNSTNNTMTLYWTPIATGTIAATVLSSGTPTSGSMGATQGAITGPLAIGNKEREPCTETFSGAIDEVRISNIARSATNMLFFNAGVFVTSNPYNALTSSGGSASFTASYFVSRDYPTFTYQWYEGAVGSGTPVVSPDGNGATFTGITGPTLTINNAPSADNGNTYYCVATQTTSALTASTTAATLTVRSPLNLKWLGTGNGGANTTWDTSSVDWFDTVGLDDTAFTTGDNVTLDDSGGGGTVTLNSTVQPSSVTFNNTSTSYTLSGSGSIIPSTITNASGATVFLPNVTKNNAGTVTISTANSYLGVTTLNGGVVSVPTVAIGGVASPLGAASNSPTNLVFNGGDLSYSGTTGSTDRGATIQSGGGEIDVTTAANTLTMSGSILGSSGGGFTNGGSGILNLTGSNSFNGTTTINGGNLELSGSGTFGTGNVINNGTLWLSGNLSIANNISGTGSLTNDSTGTLTLIGANSYTGNTTVNGGLIVSNSTSLGTGAQVTPLVTVNSTTTGAVGGTRVTLDAGVSTPTGTTLSLPSAGSSTTVNTVRSVLYAAGTSSWNGPITLVGDNNDDIIALGGLLAGTTLTINGNITAQSSFTGNSSFQLRGNGSATINGVINGTINLGTASVVVTDGDLWTINSTGNTWGSTTNAFGTLQIGANNALPTGSTNSFGGSGNATLDLNGFSQQVGDLVVVGNTAVITNSSTSSPATLVFNSLNSSSFSGSIKDGGAAAKPMNLTVSGGTLTLTAANPYYGITLVNGGTLTLGASASIANSTNINVSSGTLNLSALASYTLSGTQSLLGSGTITAPTTSAAVATASGTKIIPGAVGTPGTLTINGGLNLASGATASFALGSSTTPDGGNNSLVNLSGVLTANGNFVHITALSPAANLDETGSPYVLFTNASSVAGTGFNATPIWDVAPLDYRYWVVKTVGNQIQLVYTTVEAPLISATATPSTLARNQSSLITATVTPGSGTISSPPTVNATAIGGSASLTLVANGVANTYTNTVTIPNTLAAGIYALTASVTDSSPDTASSSISVTVLATNEIWNGASLATENWSDDANWVSGIAPALTGDSVEFAANGTTVLTPNLDQNFSVTGVLFDSTAGAMTIGTTANTLTLTGTGVTNNSANLQTINVPITMSASQTFNTATDDIKVGGAIAGSALGLTKTGSGTLTLSGLDTYTGPNIVSAGTLNVTGTVGSGVTSSTSTATMTLANTAGNAVLDSSGTLTAYNFNVGTVSGAVGAVYQTGGTVTATLAAGGTDFDIGNAVGAFGYYDAAGGTLAVNEIGVGGEANSGNAIMDINGAAVNDTGWIVVSRAGAAETGVLNIFSGTVSYAGGGLVCNWGTGQTAMVNMLGGTVTLTSANEPINLNETGNTGNLGILNLNGGSMQAGYVEGGLGQVNFNGGTLKASEAQAVMMTGLGSASIYSGGATINNNGFALTIAQPLLAPAGNGVSAVTSFTGGTGYIAPPIVVISGGGGSNATAIAQINPATGVVTNVMITCPGVNYTSTPTFTFSGGGATAQAAVSAASLAANTSGGLTNLGAGTLTLTGASTYSGPTVISAGTLALGSGGSISNSSVSLAGGATFDVSAAASPYVMGGSSFTASGDAAANLKGASGGFITNTRPTTLVLTSVGGAIPLPALTVTQGTLVLSNNQFTINGPPLPTGNYTVINTSGAGAIADNSSPANTYPTPTGTALTWPATTASISVQGGNTVVLAISSTTACAGGISAPTDVIGVNGSSVPIVTMNFASTNGLYSVVGFNMINCLITNGVATIYGGTTVPVGFGTPYVISSNGFSSGSGTATILPLGTTNLSLVATEYTTGEGANSARVNAQVTDGCNDTVSFDPITASLYLSESGEVRIVFNNISQNEKYVSLKNGTPGLRYARIIVNGTVFALNDLANGANQVVDIASALVGGTGNTVVVEGFGAKGAGALISIGETPADPASGSIQVSAVASTVTTFINLPTLQITQENGNQAVLSWPTTGPAGEDFTAYQLQTSASGAPGSWSAVGTAPTSGGGQLTVTVTAGSSVQFYQLADPTAQ